ncbi:MAG: DNA-invertase hin [Bacteroidota bacterium]|jgi:DNA invertase Pin-like site-specific DNA recombinase
MKIVTYKRVSTQRQGLSGLGLEAQEAAIQAYISEHSAEVIGDFIEIESGRKANRPQLNAAIALAKKQKATLVVAKLDRLARNVHFVSGLLESKVDFVALDFPQANKFTLHIMAAMAEHEALMISQRTKAALDAAKNRGIQLGRNGKILGAQNRNAAHQFANSLKAEIIAAIQTCRKKTLQNLANKLNSKGLRTRQGSEFKATTVARLLNRLELAM